MNRDEQTTHSMMTMIPKDLFSGWVPSPTCTCWLKPASYPFFRWIHAVSKPCEPHKQWVFWNRFVVFFYMCFIICYPPTKHRPLAIRSKVWNNLHLGCQTKSGTSGDVRGRWCGWDGFSLGMKWGSNGSWIIITLRQIWWDTSGTVFLTILWNW